MGVLQLLFRYPLSDFGKDVIDGIADGNAYLCGAGETMITRTPRKCSLNERLPTRFFPEAPTASLLVARKLFQRSKSSQACSGRPGGHEGSSRRLAGDKTLIFDDFERCRT